VRFVDIRIRFFTAHQGLSCTIQTMPRHHHPVGGDFYRKEEGGGRWKGAPYHDFSVRGSFPSVDQKGVQIFVSGSRGLSDWVTRTVLVWSST
jgi:hypothetical protein